MSTLLALWRRELASHFLSPVGYLIAVLFLATTGFYFCWLVDSHASSRTSVAELMSQLYLVILFGLLLVVPLLTMRTLAEEKRSGTIETLLTVPVTDGSIVFSKFLAASTFLTLLFLPVLAYPFLLQRFVAESPPLVVAPILLGAVGLVLIGSFFVSVGCLCSALTRSQLVAAMFSFTVLLLIFLLGEVDTLFYLSNVPWARQLSAYADLVEHQERFARGVLDTRPVVCCLSGALLVLMITVRSLEARRW